MPSLGSVSSNYAPGTTEEVQAFARALKHLIPYVEPGATMEAKARLLAISPSLLSHWLCGRRLPVPSALESLYNLATDGARRKAATPLICSLAELEQLLSAARRSTCRRCQGDCSCSGSKRDRRNTSTQSADPRPTAEARDRRNSSPTMARQQNATQQETGLLERLAGLPLADQVNLLWSLGATLEEEEIGAAASALSEADMRQEMEIILRAAESSGKDSVKIMIAFGGTRRSAPQ